MADTVPVFFGEGPNRTLVGTGVYEGDYLVITLNDGGLLSWPEKMSEYSIEDSTD